MVFTETTRLRKFYLTPTARESMVEPFQAIQSMHFDEGVYGLDESKFVFPNVIVGRRASARFKIINTHKLEFKILKLRYPLRN